jgi:hypothetical protein
VFGLDRVFGIWSYGWVFVWLSSLSPRFSVVFALSPLSWLCSAVGALISLFDLRLRSCYLFDATGALFQLSSLYSRSPRRISPMFLPSRSVHGLVSFGSVVPFIVLFVVVWCRFIVRLLCFGSRLFLPFCSSSASWSPSLLIAFFVVFVASYVCQLSAPRLHFVAWPRPWHLGFPRVGLVVDSRVGWFCIWISRGVVTFGVFN